MLLLALWLFLWHPLRCTTKALLWPVTSDTLSAQWTCGNGCWQVAAHAAFCCRVSWLGTCNKERHCPFRIDCG